MNAELQEAFDLARTLDLIITFSEHHLASEPVVSAAIRIRKCIIEELWIAKQTLNYPPISLEESKRIDDALNKGQIPSSTASIGDFLPKLIGSEITALEDRLITLRRLHQKQSA
jgi:hypothetical protein